MTINELPKFEMYETGQQIRRSAKSARTNIVEGYGRKRYKADFLKFLTYSHASCDEATAQLASLVQLYPEYKEFNLLFMAYEELGKQICSFIKYVESSWRN